MEEKFRDIQRMLNSVYELTEFIPASGQNLDRLAMARQELRNIAQILESVLGELGKEGGNG